MRTLLLLLGVLALVLPAAAEEVWVLREGPQAVEGIPLTPFQPVPGWRGLYGDGTGTEAVWLYATRSPHFFPPASPEVRTVTGTAWTVVAFFPEAWKPAQRGAWLDLWVGEFRILDSLPDRGWPILLPAVLRKG